MSKLDGYKPFTVVKNAINRLESQEVIKLKGEKDEIVELITKYLIDAGVLREFINIGRPSPINIHNSLEEFITDGGRVIFIHKMKFDNNQGIFTLEKAIRS